MSRFKKIISVVLSFSILLSVAAIKFSLNVAAATVKVAMVYATAVSVRETPSTNGKKLDSISSREVTVIGDSSAEWLNVTYIKDGKQYTGYIFNNPDWVYITEYNYDDSFENQLSKFPESYRGALRELYSKYPNWKFIPDFVNMSFEEAVRLQESEKQTQGGISWRTMGQGSYDWNTGKWVENNGGWFYASREAIAYYMDPRNFLNSSEIYMFLKQEFDYGSHYTEEGLAKIVAGTFLANGYSDPNDPAYEGSYIKVLMEAGKQSGISPYILASALIQEQGSKGTSSLISGEHGCYNFFNYGASGKTKELVIQNGVATAKKYGWTTRSASIIGGAKKYKNGYIGIGQDTYFLQDFNIHFPIVDEDTGIKQITHQYAEAVHDARGKGFQMNKLYSGITDSSLTFRIPVYTSIPSTVSPKPADNNNYNNYYFKNISVSGLTPSFGMFTYSGYNLHVTDDTIIDVTVPDTAAYASSTEFALNQGNNIVTLTVQSQSGYTNSYTINVNADKACTLYINRIGGSLVSGGPHKNGDVNGDGKISAGDMANIRLHLLGKYTLGGANLTAADINKDGKISASDLANVRLHLLGKYTIKD